MELEARGSKFKLICLTSTSILSRLYLACGKSTNTNIMFEFILFNNFTTFLRWP